MTNDNPRGLPVARYSMEEPTIGPMCHRAYVMVDDDEGEYVLATDYEKLLAERDELRAKLRAATDDFRDSADYAGYSDDEKRVYAECADAIDALAAEGRNG